MKRIVKIKAPRIKRPPYYVIAFQHDAFRGLFSFDHIQSFGHSFFSLFSKQQKKGRHGVSKSHRSTGSTIATCPDESSFYLQRPQQHTKRDAAQGGTRNQYHYLR